MRSSPFYMICFLMMSLPMLITSRVIGNKGSDCDPFEEYACANDSLCIPREFLCDAFKDCHGGDDELIPACDLNKCAYDEFACTDDRCIPDDWLCDEDDDCGDGSDEMNVICSNRNDFDHVDFRYGLDEELMPESP